MVHTTRTAPTARSLPAIPMRRSLCHRVRVACRARRPRMRPLRVTGICKRLPNMAAWVGRKRRGTDSDGQSGEKADLSHAQLQGVSLWSADLREADISYANLQGADM